MIDAHVHLEKGPYTKEWLGEFIKVAQERKIEEVYFLEHTHIFQEFDSLYKEMSEYNEYQHNWFLKKRKAARPIKEYLAFVQDMKKESWPIKIKFGLEVCYSPEHEEEIAELKNNLNLDFMVGSIHFIDGWAFSHLKQRWSKEEVDLVKVYSRYYELMFKLAASKLFDGLAHPNSLQCFGAYPPEDYSKLYKSLAVSLMKNNLYIEESSGLATNYGDRVLGMNNSMLKEMKEAGVKILTASDAHYPKYVGEKAAEMASLIQNVK